MQDFIDVNICALYYLFYENSIKDKFTLNTLQMTKSDINKNTTKLYFDSHINFSEIQQSY